MWQTHEKLRMEPDPRKLCPLGWPGSVFFKHALWSLGVSETGPCVSKEAGIEGVLTQVPQRLAGAEAKARRGSAQDTSAQLPVAPQSGVTVHLHHLPFFKINGLFFREVLGL